jgi:hypothetical protein
MRCLLVLVLSFALCACEEPVGDVTAEAGVAIVAGDERYRVLAESTSTGPGKGALELRVEMLNGWHIAEGAPVKLDLTSLEVEIAPANLRVEHAHLLGENEIEWRCELESDAGGEGVAQVKLKLGICEGSGDECVIVQHEFGIPLALADR